MTSLIWLQIKAADAVARFSIMLAPLPVQDIQTIIGLCLIADGTFRFLRISRSPFNLKVSNGTPFGLRIYFQSFENQFSVFDMGERRVCDDNYVEIIDAEAANTQRFCGDDTPAPFRGQTSRLTVRFVKTTSFSGTGWSINFMAVHENSKLENF